MPHRAQGLGFVLLLVAGCATGVHTQDGVSPGIEVLLSDSLHLIAGRRVGLLTNQTGVDRHGTSDVDRLLAAGAEVTAILSPEHGYRGVLDRDGIDHGVDSAKAIPVFSLYGTTRAPTADMLAMFDVLLVDLQDIGARPYTYSSTMLLSMRAAGAADIPVLVLDRPNPIGGVLVQGPVLESAYASFVGMLPIPLRHGMTLGELALFGNDELGLRASLTVVPVRGWRRTQWHDDVALPWVRPSPNMPSLESAAHYPGLVLFEATGLSVGRGTPIAFQLVGAPWLDTRAVIDIVGSLAGVRLADTLVTPVSPSDGKNDGEAIQAIRLRVTDRDVYDPVAVAIRLMAAINSRHPRRLDATDRLDRLYGSPQLRQALGHRVTAQSLIAAWEAPLELFALKRAGYLLYLGR